MHWHLPSSVSETGIVIESCDIRVQFTLMAILYCVYIRILDNNALPYTPTPPQG